MNKRCKISLCGLLSLLTIFIACTPDSIDNDVPQKGVPTKVAINFNVGKFPVKSITRAAIDPVEENRVHNLYLFIFEDDGTVSTRKFFEYDELLNKTETATATKGTVTISTVSGTKDIYAIANIGDKQPIGNITKDLLDAVANKTALENLMVDVRSEVETVERIDGKMLMSGTVQAAISPGSTTPITIPIKRVDAKITFEIKYDPNPADLIGITFTPTSWEVVRLPKRVRLVEKSDSPDGGVSDNAQFFNSGKKVFASESAFTFYQYENLKAPKEQIPGTGAEAYALREKHLKTPAAGGDVTNGSYKYAADNATAVIIRGEFQKVDGNTMKVTSANVQYVIHLGYKDGNANDFNVTRNTNYKYTVTIKDVDKIIVEAQATDPSVEPQTGAEGWVIRQDFDLYNVFDSHYAHFIAKVPRPEGTVDISEIPKLYRVNTPFEKNGTTDIEWVKFIKNDVSTPNTVAIYPGENSPTLMNAHQMFTEVFQKHAANASNYFVTENGKEYAHFTVYVNEYFYEKDPMNPNAQPDPTLWKRFVNQPDRELLVAGKTDVSPDGKSIFSEEAILVRQKSITTVYNVTDPQSKTAIGIELYDENYGLEYTLQGPTNQSYGNTSETDGWANSVLDWFLIPWTGTPPANPRDNAHWTSNPDARKWENFIDRSSVVPSNPYGWGTYQLSGTNAYHPGGINKVRIACMSRNLDLNGNGYIDKDEVRWYLPAIGQFVDMWVGGRNAMPHQRFFKGLSYHTAFEQAHGLYPYPKYAFHTTSTNRVSGNARSNPIMLWASQGAAIGNVSQATQSNYIGSQGRKYLYTRCARNLGGDSPSSLPGEFAVHDAENRTISLVDPSITSRVSRDSYRDTKVDFFTGQHKLYHYEFDSDANVPPSKFQYAKNLFGNGTFREFVNINFCKNYTEEPGGADKGTWRMPNQREALLIMRFQQFFPAGNTTSFAWCSSISELWPGTGYRVSNISMGTAPANDTNNHRYPTRCVRDVKD